MQLMSSDCCMGVFDDLESVEIVAFLAAISDLILYVKISWKWNTPPCSARARLEYPYCLNAFI